MAKANKKEESNLTPAEKAKLTKAANQKKAEEAQRQEALARELAELRREPLPPANHLYKVNEEARPRTARWKKITVLKVEDEGKILFCRVDFDHEERGQKYPQSKERYLSHLELIPMSTKISTQVLNKRRERPRDISYSNQMLDGLLSKHYRGKIDYSPEYQRGRVWEEADKIALLDSIFSRIAIGSFVFVELPWESVDKPTYEIIDGKQRLLTLIDFFEDRLRYKGLTFSELCEEDKREFLNYDVAVGRLGESTTLLQKYDYFLRLNTGGKPQSEEHLNEIRAKITQLKANNAK